MTSSLGDNAPDLREQVLLFAGGPLADGVRQPRSQSYDHCYNYFRSTPRPTGDLEKSCAVLGFYLASWGMYRGSTFLFKHTNSAVFVDLIAFIEQNGERLRAIDLDSYGPDAYAALRECFFEIEKRVLKHSEGRSVASLTLVTKIMVAVFGNVPAFDSYFVAGMNRVLGGGRGRRLNRFSAANLGLLREFYDAHAGEIDGLAAEGRTVPFSRGGPTFPLTRAKILDMYGFQLGSQPTITA